MRAPGVRVHLAITGGERRPKREQDESRRCAAVRRQQKRASPCRHVPICSPHCISEGSIRVNSSATARLSLRSPPPIDCRPEPPEAVESGLLEVRGDGMGSMSRGRPAHSNLISNASLTSVSGRSRNAGLLLYMGAVQFHDEDIAPLHNGACQHQVARLMSFSVVSSTASMYGRRLGSACRSDSIS